MELSVDFWDVGQGDCSVIRLPDQKLLVIDVGPPDCPIIEWLSARNEQIHSIVLTHNDEDHAGCFPALLERFSSRIENVFVLVDRHTTALPAKRILGCAAAGAKKKLFNLRQLDTSQTGTLAIYGHEAQTDKLLIYAVHPDFVATLGNQLKKVPQPNQVSAVLRLDVNGINQLIWAGDAPIRVVADKCEGLAPEAMIGPHHGAPTDRNSPRHHLDYKRVSPRNVFISVGTANSHNHPVKQFIDLHRERHRRVVCSQLVHCDIRRVENRDHVMRHHLEFGMVPPQNVNAVTCRGPMRLTWDSAVGKFVHDEFHARHLRMLEDVHRPYCMGGLMRESPLRNLNERM